MARKSWNNVTRCLFFSSVEVADACRRASNLFLLDGNMEQSERFADVADAVELGYWPAKDAAKDLLYALERTDLQEEMC